MLGCVQIEKRVGFWFGFFSSLKAHFCFQDAKQESRSRVLQQRWLKHPWKVSPAKELSGLFSLQDPAAGLVFPTADDGQVMARERFWLV